MKLSYSTRGWYNLPFEELVQAAPDMRFAGIELYDLHKHPELFEKGALLNKYNAERLLRQLRDSKVELVCLDTSVDLTTPEAKDTMLWTIEKAASLRVPYVSAEVMSDNEEAAVSLIAELLPVAKSNKVFMRK